jgi:hypothetical protein
VFQLIEFVQAPRRAANALYLVVLVRAGARFEAALLVERDERLAA